MRNAKLTRFFFLFLLLGLSACSERRQLKQVNEAEEKITQGSYGEAVAILKKAIVINPESKTAIKALYKLGFILENYLKDYDGAIGQYQEFIRLSLDKVSRYEVQKRIANLYFDQYREPEKAIAAYKKLISFNPESLETDLFQFRIGQSYFRQNNFEQARYEYQQLLERFPKSQFTARTRFEIGNAYYMEGKYDIAEQAWQQVVRNHTQSEYATEAQFMMAQCLEHQDKLQNALQMYETLTGRYPASDVLELRVAEIKKRIAKKK